jgi:AraC family transcriptional regulator
MDGNSSPNLACVYSLLRLIEEHYDQEISVRQLEDTAHYSYRNVQRIFKYTCGETIGAYQKRLRVENAYKLLLYTNDTITAIALQVGFANLASFSKAFKQQFNCAPQEARSNKTQLFTEGSIHPVESDTPLQPEIIYLPRVQVFYETAFIPYENDQIEKLWERFAQNEFPGNETVYYGIIADEPLITEELKCRYDACASTQALNRELPSKTILGGRYARFIHPGTYETIDATYQRIYAGWMLETDLEFDHTPIVEQYMRHADNPESVEDQLTGILLPLK